MAVQLTQQDMQHLCQILSEFPEFATVSRRYNFMTSILAGVPKGTRLLTRIDFDGPAATVSVEVIHLLGGYGEIMSGREALVLLVDALLDNRGEDDTTDFLRMIIDRYKMKVDEKPVAYPNTTGIHVPDVVPDASMRYVFISYARPQSVIADTIETYLRTANFRVFRDITDIQGGMDWNRAIERVLDEATHMVLLLSNASMPYRKEVYREWFAFDQANKPIIPFYIDDCKLPSRLISINYIDARVDLSNALSKLIVALLQ
jgi:hypothetical protein